MLDCSGQGAGAEQAGGKENKDWEMSLQHSYALQWWGQNGRMEGFAQDVNLVLDKMYFMIILGRKQQNSVKQLSFK